MNKIVLISVSLILALVVGLAGCGGERLVTQTVLITTTITLAPVMETVTTMVEVTKTVTVTETVTTMVDSSTVTVTSPPVTDTVTETTVVTKTTTPTQPSHVYQVVEDISYIITEKSSNYWYFSWKVTIKNMHFEELTLYIEVNFLDSDGFSLEWGNDISTFNPGETKTIYGEEMIGADIAGNVVKAVVDIEPF